MSLVTLSELANARRQRWRSRFKTLPELAQSYDDLASKYERQIQLQKAGKHVPREARDSLRADIQEAIGLNMLNDESIADSIREIERMQERRLNEKEVREIRENMESVDDAAILNQLRVLKKNVEFDIEISIMRAKINGTRREKKCCVM